MNVDRSNWQSAYWRNINETQSKSSHFVIRMVYVLMFFLSVFREAYYDPHLLPLNIYICKLIVKLSHELQVVYFILSWTKRKSCATCVYKDMSMWAIYLLLVVQSIFAVVVFDMSVTLINQIKYVMRKYKRAQSTFQFFCGFRLNMHHTYKCLNHFSTPRIHVHRLTSITLTYSSAFKMTWERETLDANRFLLKSTPFSINNCYNLIFTYLYTFSVWVLPSNSNINHEKKIKQYYTIVNCSMHFSQLNVFQLLLMCIFFISFLRKLLDPGFLLPETKWQFHNYYIYLCDLERKNMLLYVFACKSS